MKKFFFDDVRDAPSSSWTLARDVSQARYILLQEPFDIMSLDHDIGFQMACHSCIEEVFKESGNDSIAISNKLAEGCKHCETGTTLARWMCDYLTKWPRIILIHSANPYGQERMLNILKEHVTREKINCAVICVPFDKRTIELYVDILGRSN